MEEFLEEQGYLEEQGFLEVYMSVLVEVVFPEGCMGDLRE